MTDPSASDVLGDVSMLDLGFQLDQTIASYLIPLDDGVALVESGPHSTWDGLTAQLAARGLAPSDVRHVLLTHIHFDHGGAAWALAAAGATVHVHPVGLDHLADPERLYESARRIYGAQMEPLWGLMQPIDRARLRAAADREALTLGGRELVAHHTPGHAKHHIAWQLGDVVFTGDVAGIRLGRGPVTPPCPPPDIDLDAWAASIARLRELSPRVLALTHYGPYTDVAAHLAQLERQLEAWSSWIRPHWQAGREAQALVPEFEAMARAQLAEQGLDATERRRYDAANPAFMSVAGLLRWWTKLSDGRERWSPR